MSTKGLIEENQINTSYTKRKYLTPKEIAAFVLVNFGQKILISMSVCIRNFL